MEFDEKKLKKDLKKGLRYNQSLIELREILIRYKEQGGKKEEAMFVLDNLRRKTKSEKSEDMILELMDIVEGFCQSHLKIWE